MEHENVRSSGLVLLSFGLACSFADLVPRIARGRTGPVWRPPSAHTIKISYTFFLGVAMGGTFLWLGGYLDMHALSIVGVVAVVAAVAAAILHIKASLSW